MLTIWANDNAECDTFANLFSISHFAELCYDKNATGEKLASRFEATTGADYDLFYKMSYYQNDFENNSDYPAWSHRFLGKPLFWQDVLAGLYDTHLFKKPMSEHYAMTRDFYKDNFSGRWGYLYEYAYRIFDYLAEKTYIAERLYPAYKSGDKDTLRALAVESFPALIEKTEALHKVHRATWFKNNKVMGWQNLDIRYSGVVGRCETAILLINEYLSGNLEKIEELEEERLHKPLSGFIHYDGIATVNLAI